MPPPDGRLSRTLRLATAFVLLLTACTDTDGGEDDGESAAIQPAKVLLRVGVEAWPECLNPLTCNSPVLRQQILRHVLPVAFEIDAANRYQPSPLLAGEPETRVTDDGMRITYRIDADARWDDGRPVTSSDFRGTWQAVLSTRHADTTGYDRIVDIDDSDPLVAIVTLAEPYAEWRELFGGASGWVLQADELGPDLDLTGRFADELPFSASAYHLAAWDSGDAVLTAVEGYWGFDEPRPVDQVRFTRVSIDELDEPTRFDVLVPEGSGGAPPDGFVARELPITSVIGVWFDRRTRLLDDRIHRQAIAAAVDREALAGSLDRRRLEAGLDCLGWLPDVGPWCELAAVELPAHDPDLAAFVLGTVGWQVSPFGTLVRGEEFFAVPLTHDPLTPGTEEIADAVEAALAGLGIAVERRGVASTMWAGSRSAGESTGIGVFVVDLGVTPQVPGYACDDGLESSVMLWCPADVVASARALRTTVDADVQAELVERIGTAAGADVAWLPIAQLAETAFVREGRLSVPDAVPVSGGALSGLTSFRLVE